ncbi:hypothetical protein [Nocardiopsis potens]|uniref:hypothetical protein n=1 Tax=Nocardiopsis potens TaxID=1246458 RepID=UPI000381E9EB|nr:hypothetical protein [Nocardiopsis potens]
MIVVQPVLEVYPVEGFDLWPVAGVEAWSLLPLSGGLAPDEVGTAVMAIAACNDIDPAPEVDGRPPRPGDPLQGFLHGLLTMGDLFASGGLRVQDTATGAVLVPGCCSGLDERRDWYEVTDGEGRAGFGHDPSPLAERVGETARLTADADQEGGPVIELPVTELRRLLAGAERDLAGFLDSAAAWAAGRLPDQAGPVTAALARALDLPRPAPGP